MVVDRRSFLRCYLAAPSVLAAGQVVAARPPIDSNCYVDWELLDGRHDVWVDDDVTPTGFYLEIASERGAGPYLGRIAWWILPDERTDRSRALLNGIAQCQKSEIYQDASEVSVQFDSY